MLKKSASSNSFFSSLKSHFPKKSIIMEPDILFLYASPSATPCFSLSSKIFANFVFGSSSLTTKYTVSNFLFVSSKSFFFHDLKTTDNSSGILMYCFRTFTYSEFLILKMKIKCFLSSFKWRVTMSGELMFLESYGNCDVTNTLTFRL